MQYCDVIVTVPVSFVYYKEEFFKKRAELTTKSTVTIIGDVTGKEAKSAITTAYPKADRTDVVIRSITRHTLNFGMSEAKYRRLSVEFDQETLEPITQLNHTKTRRHYDSKYQRMFYKLITKDGHRLD